MKAKDQVEFSEAIQSLDDEDLEKVREILLSKDMTDDNMTKLKHVDIAIESRERHRRYMDKLWLLSIREIYRKNANLE